MHFKVLYVKTPTEATRAWLCLCHLLTWFSVITEAVFYTDFKGQVIFKGNPQAPSNSTKWHAYNAGVKMGCWGLVIYAATGAICSGEKMACPEYRNPDLCLHRGKAAKVGCCGLGSGKLSCVLAQDTV